MNESQDYRKSYAYRFWSISVRRRDKVCQCCGSRKKREAHHILKSSDYPELRTVLENGITLCRRCHTYYHVQICGGFDKPCPEESLDYFLEKFKEERGRGYRRAQRYRKKILKS